jgi:hypothetical protein
LTQFADFFKPESLLSRDNPFLKSAAATHRALFDTLDRTARRQLAFVEDLLDLNRERFELLYSGKSFTETLGAQQDLVIELGRCTARYTGDLQDIAMSLGFGLAEAGGEAANDAAAGAARKTGASKSEKTA